MTVPAHGPGLHLHYTQRVEGKKRENVKRSKGWGGRAGVFIKNIWKSMVRESEKILNERDGKGVKYVSSQ